MFSLIYAWINSWVNNGEAGDLRRHSAHYVVIVMNHFHNNDKAQQRAKLHQNFWDTVYMIVVSCRSQIVRICWIYKFYFGNGFIADRVIWRPGECVLALRRSYASVKWVNIGSGLLPNCSAPNHLLTQWRLIVYRTGRNKLQRNSIKIQQFSLKKMHLKMSSATTISDIVSASMCQTVNIYTCVPRTCRDGDQGPLLLSWINFKPSMDK